MCPYPIDNHRNHSTQNGKEPDPMAYMETMIPVARFAEVEELGSKDRCDGRRGQEEHGHDGDGLHASTIALNHAVIVL